MRDRDSGAEPRLELLFQGREPRLHLERGPAGAQRIVLVRLGRAEHCEHGVAHEVLDRAPSSAERISWKYDGIRLRIVSASTCSPIAVDPERSQNTSVASFRLSATGRARTTPQNPQ